MNSIRVDFVIKDEIDQNETKITSDRRRCSKAQENLPVPAANTCRRSYSPGKYDVKGSHIRRGGEKVDSKSLETYEDKPLEVRWSPKCQIPIREFVPKDELKSPLPPKQMTSSRGKIEIHRNVRQFFPFPIPPPPPNPLWELGTHPPNRDMLNIDLDNEISSRRKLEFHQQAPPMLSSSRPKSSGGYSSQRNRSKPSTNGPIVNYSKSVAAALTETSVIHSGKRAVSGKWTTKTTTIDVDERAKPQGRPSKDRESFREQYNSGKYRSADVNMGEILKESRSHASSEKSCGLSTALTFY